MSTNTPVSEDERRAAALARYRILDTSPEAAFDDLVRLASLICDAPISLITLLDSRRQWFKAKLGIDVSETPLDRSFCRYAIEKAEVTVVPDATRDNRFANNPFVTGAPGIRFYAGAPLITPDGIAVGTICTIDRTARKELTPNQQLALQIVAKQVIAQLELRRLLRERETSNQQKERA